MLLIQEGEQSGYGDGGGAAEGVAETTLYCAKGWIDFVTLAPFSPCLPSAPAAPGGPWGGWQDCFSISTHRTVQQGCRNKNVHHRPFTVFQRLTSVVHFLKFCTMLHHVFCINALVLNKKWASPVEILSASWHFTFLIHSLLNNRLPR